MKYCAQCVNNTAQHIQHFHLLNKEQLQVDADDNPSISEDPSFSKPRMGRGTKTLKLIDSDDESDEASSSDDESDDESDKAFSMSSTTKKAAGVTPHHQSKSIT